MPRTGHGRRWPRGRLSASTVGRIWHQFDLKPHLVDGFKLCPTRSSWPVVDVVGLYHHPPDKAVVLCVDEKSQMQALDQSHRVADDARHA